MIFLPLVISVLWRFLNDAMTIRNNFAHSHVWSSAHETTLTQLTPTTQAGELRKCKNSITSTGDDPKEYLEIRTCLQNACRTVVLYWKLTQPPNQPQRCNLSEDSRQAIDKRWQRQQKPKVHLPYLWLEIPATSPPVYVHNQPVPKGKRNKRSNGAWNGSLVCCPLQPGHAFSRIHAFFFFPLFFFFFPTPHSLLLSCFLTAAPSSFPVKSSYPLPPHSRMLYFLTIMEVGTKTAAGSGLPPNLWQGRAPKGRAVAADLPCDSQCCWQGQGLHLGWPKKKKKCSGGKGGSLFFSAQLFER